jgi:hypothetical protein
VDFILGKKVNAKGQASFSYIPLIALALGGGLLFFLLRRR